jgi:hypothetical protein
MGNGKWPTRATQAEKKRATFIGKTHKNVFRMLPRPGKGPTVMQIGRCLARLLRGRDSNYVPLVFGDVGDVLHIEIPMR